LVIIRWSPPRFATEADLGLITLLASTATQKKNRRFPMKSYKKYLAASGFVVLLIAAVVYPRNADTSVPKPDSQTDLLFPFATSRAGFDTALAIANTSADPFGTPQKSGSCTLSFFGDTAPAPLTTPTIAAGTTFTLDMFQAAQNFQGYVIARCEFPFAHGVYFVGSLGFSSVMSSGDAVILSPNSPPKRGLKKD
jgi:hypothetical protein